MVEDKLEIMADPNENQAERRAAGGTESADHAAATANGSSSNRNEAPASIDAAATPEASSTTPDTSAPEGAQGESRPGSEAARKTSADQRLKSGEPRPSGSKGATSSGLRITRITGSLRGSRTVVMPTFASPRPRVTPKKNRRAETATPDTSAPEGAQGESRPGSEAARKTSADQRLKSGESRPSTLVPTKPGLETAALSKSEATPVQDAGPAPPASLLPMDFLGAGERPVDAARLPPEAPGLSAVDPKTETPPATSEEPRADPAWRIAHDRKRPAWRAGRGLPALAAALALAALLGAGWQAQRAGWLDVEAPTAAAPEAGGETLAQDAPEPASAIPEQSVEPAAAPTETSEPDTPEPIQPSIAPRPTTARRQRAAVTEEPSGAQPWNLNGAELVEMERLLVRLALEPSSSDGIVDRQTKRAIRLYQQMAGLPVDGEPSRALLTDMREVVKILDSGT